MNMSPASFPSPGTHSQTAKGDNEVTSYEITSWRQPRAEKLVNHSQNNSHGLEQWTVG